MEYKVLLKQADLKQTNARLSVLSFLDFVESPVSAEEIYDHILHEHHEADRATIYRILDAFVKKGIATKLEFGEGKYRYELVGDDHHHLICKSCGSVSDIMDCNVAGLEKDIQEKKGFTIQRHSLEFYGLCHSCQR